MYAGLLVLVSEVHVNLPGFLVAYEASTVMWLWVAWWRTVSTVSGIHIPYL